jgi:hypothetical protein
MTAPAVSPRGTTSRDDVSDVVAVSVDADADARHRDRARPGEGEEGEYDDDARRCELARGSA